MMVNAKIQSYFISDRRMGEGRAYPVDDGKYVLYADHAAAIDERDYRIKELEGLLTCTDSFIDVLSPRQGNGNEMTIEELQKDVAEMTRQDIIFVKSSFVTGDSDAADSALKKSQDIANKYEEIFRENEISMGRIEGDFADILRVIVSVCELMGIGERKRR